MAVIRTASQSSPRWTWAAVAPFLALGVVLLVLALVLMGQSGRGTLQIVMQHATGAAQQPGGTVTSGGGSGCVGTLPPNTQPMAFPSKESYERLLADPSLPERDPELLREFEAAPWLLPPRTKALPYAGVHDLDQLAAMRATKEGEVDKAISLLTFNPNFGVMAQNTIYSMVKFAGVRNYIVGNWEKADLEACADLNLPCADVSAYLPEPLDHGEGSGAYGTHDYFVITWLSSFIVRDLLKKGYTVHYSDADIAYAIKPLWASYLAFIDEVKADAAFQVEYGLINTGNYVALPTPGSIAMWEGWSGSAHEGIKEKQHDQQFLDRIHGNLFRRCVAPASCGWVRDEMTAQNLTGKVAFLRAFLHGYFMYSDDICTLSRPHLAPLFDTCDWSIMFFHPLCTGYDGKRTIFIQEQMWFVNEDRCLPRNGTMSQAKACEPMRWVQPGYEQHLYNCPNYPLALTHSRPVQPAPPPPSPAPPSPAPPAATR